MGCPASRTLASRGGRNIRGHPIRNGFARGDRAPAVSVRAAAGVAAELVVVLPPVAGPFPYVAGHLVQAVPVGREGADGCHQPRLTGRQGLPHSWGAAAQNPTTTRDNRQQPRGRPTSVGTPQVISASRQIHQRAREIRDPPDRSKTPLERRLQRLCGADAVVAGMMLELCPPEQFEDGGDVVGEAAAVALA